MITASLSNHRISPRKVRVVANMIRGKSVANAHSILSGALKKAKGPLHDLLDSAVANAKNNFQLDSAQLFVKEIRVDQGVTMKRHRPVSRGSAHPIKKRTSHVSIVLAPLDQSQSPKSISRKSVKTIAKK
jgi:large subunit ribosomal protein L22